MTPFSLLSPSTLTISRELPDAFILKLTIHTLGLFVLNISYTSCFLQVLYPKLYPVALVDTYH
jgi:hypothetical protein